MRLREKRHESEKVFEGNLINVRLDTVILPNGEKARRETVEHPGAAAVVPVSKEGNIILVRQYRNPIDEIILEIPAGKLEPGEDPQDCAMRELQEETGYKSDSLKHLATFYTTPGFSNEILYLYAALDLKRASKNLDPEEFIEVVGLPLSELRDMVQRKEIVDAKTLIGIMMLGGIVGDQRW